MVLTNGLIALAAGSMLFCGLATVWSIIEARKFMRLQIVFHEMCVRAWVLQTTGGMAARAHFPRPAAMRAPFETSK